jgi:hypothetical protein
VIADHKQGGTILITRLLDRQPNADVIRHADAASPGPFHIRRGGEAIDIVTIAFDPVAGLIRAHAGGDWSEEEVRRYIDALTGFVDAARAGLGKARVLLDRRDVVTQSPAVAAALAKANGAIFQSEDKIALVVSSSLAKSVLRQRMPHPGTKAFLSIDAAETWLQAFAPL